jgi:omega-6 fatty acid desaturase (delta-12 desaturase)
LASFTATFSPFHWSIRLVFGVLTGLLMVRFFILYHDYNHFAILKNSFLGKILMTTFGIFILAPVTIWKRTHDYHHWNNSKLSNNGVGSYPLLAREDFLALPKKEQLLYMIVRHPLTIAFGYITLFLFDFNIKTFFQSPKKHWDSIIALTFHITVAVLLYQYFGLSTLLISWTIPFLVANGSGSYLFYAQHNFPGAQYVENKDWNYFNAAIISTSFLKTNEVMNWFTGDIGYHHVHHLNHQIPFYRLREAMAGIPEMQHPIETSLSPKDIIACLRLKVWDPELKQMAPL